MAASSRGRGKRRRRSRDSLSLSLFLQTYNEEEPPLFGACGAALVQCWNCERQLLAANWEIWPLSERQKCTVESGQRKSVAAQVGGDQLGENGRPFLAAEVWGWLE